MFGSSCPQQSSPRRIRGYYHLGKRHRYYPGVAGIPYTEWDPFIGQLRPGALIRADLAQQSKLRQRDGRTSGGIGSTEQCAHYCLGYESGIAYRRGCESNQFRPAVDIMLTI
jgi:hypothetical protein